MQILAVPRLYGIQPKLTVALRITTNELHFVNYGRGLQQAVWLQYANENHGAIRQHALQRNMLSGEIIPREIRSFYKEGLVFIPAGDFDATTLGLRQCIRTNHLDHSRRKESSSLASQSYSGNCKEKS